jgi:hypothetical protein
VRRRSSGAPPRGPRGSRRGCRWWPSLAPTTDPCGRGHDHEPARDLLRPVQRVADRDRLGRLASPMSSARRRRRASKQRRTPRRWLRVELALERLRLREERGRRARAERSRSARASLRPRAPSRPAPSRAPAARALPRAVAAARAAVHRHQRGRRRPAIDEPVVEVGAGGRTRVLDPDPVPFVVARSSRSPAGGSPSPRKGPHRVPPEHRQPGGRRRGELATRGGDPALALSTCPSTTSRCLHDPSEAAEKIRAVAAPRKGSSDTSSAW